MENTTAPSIFSSSRTSLVILFFLSFVYFLENFDRSLISVSPIPYIDYGSYEYSILAGPAFTIVYTLGGVIFALMSFTAEQRNEGKGIAPSALFSKFNILALTTLVFSVSFACTAFALYFWQQVIVRIVMGLAQSIITPFSTSILSDHFPPQLRGSAFGIFNLGTYLSFSLALSLGIFIYVEYGWQAGYILFGAIGVVCALIMPVFSCFHARAENAEAEREKNITDADLTAQPDIGTKSAMHSEDESETPSPSGERQSVEKRDGQLNMWQRAQSRVHAMAAIAYDVCFVRWYNAPGIYLLCLATGVRLGAGYVWVSYTGALYSDLFETEDDSSCDFSYSADFALLPDSVCDSDYPYCVDGACSALTSFPWHNKVIVCMLLLVPGM
jgi:MFS family permease